MLLYTFRTCPFRKKLTELDPNLFVFGPLKTDFEKIKKRIQEEKPGQIVGVAMTRNQSFVESVALNQFTRTKKIDPNQPSKLALNVPANSPFDRSKQPTHSFCNWTMFKIKSFVEAEKLGTTITFFHVNQKDTNKLAQWLKENKPPK